MGKTFKDLAGRSYQVDDYDEVEIDQDIVSGEIVGYFVSDGINRRTVTEETYKAVKQYYKE